MLSSSALRFAVAVAQAAGRGATTGQVASATQQLKAIAEAARLAGGRPPTSTGTKDEVFAASVTDPSSCESLAAAALNAADFVSEASRRGVRFPALQSALAAAWITGEAGEANYGASRTLAVACSVATLAASSVDDIKLARATASILTRTVPPLTDRTSTKLASRALAVALAPPANTVDRHIDLRCALIFARFFELTADSSSDLRAAAVPLLGGLLGRFEGLDRGDVSTTLILASQLRLWDTFTPEFLVDIAAKSGLYDVAEDLVAASISAYEGSPDRAACTLVTGALAASRFRQADLVARRYGLSMQFPEAVFLHVSDTISKPSFPSRLIEALVNDAAEFTDTMRGAQLRTLAVDKLVENGEILVALELSQRWSLVKEGESQELLESRLNAARQAKRSSTISFDDGFVTPAAPRSVVDTPEDLVEGLRVLLDRQSLSSEDNVVVGLDVEWDSQLHSRAKKRQRLPKSDASESEEASSSSIFHGGDDTHSSKPTAALLQLATKSRILLCDISTLSQTPSGRSTLASSMGALLADESITKLGFGIGQDVAVIKRTIRRFAEGAATDENAALFILPDHRGVVDIQGAGKAVAPRLKDRGLAEFALEFLGKPLDKTEQCSNWSIRPLRESQLEYAALDAWVPVAIMERIKALGSSTME